MPKRKFTDEQEKEICVEYFGEEKPSTITLGERWECNNLTIINALRRNGYKVRASAEYHKLFTEKQEKQICREYFSKEKPSAKVLAKKWNCTEPTIRNILRQNGYKLRTIGESRRLFTKNEEKKICQSYFSKNKIGTSTLAKKWGCCDITIKQVLIRNGYRIRTKSEAHKGLKVWCEGLTKETNNSLKKMSESLSKFSKKQEEKICKQYIENKLTTFELAKKYKCNPETVGNIVRRGGFILRTVKESCSLYTKEQELEMCKEYFSDKKPSSLILSKKWGCSLATICNIIRRNGYTLRSVNILRSLENGHGKKCYYKNEFFPSISEKDCYKKLLKLGLKVEHNFERRFDFLVNDKIVLEYHQCGWFLEKRNYDQYYNDRRKLLDNYGHKNLKLVVIKDIKEIENKLGKLI